MAYRDFWAQYDNPLEDQPFPGEPEPFPSDPQPAPTTGGGTGGGGCPPGQFPLSTAEGGGCAAPRGPDLSEWVGPLNKGMDGGNFPVFGGRTSAPNYNIPGAPRFNAPTFQPPSLADAQNEPGYASSRNEGLRAIEQSASARGSLNTGGTPKSLFKWADAYAQQNYGNVHNRALQAFDRLYAGKLDEFKPQFGEWQTRAGATVSAANLAWQREMELYQAQIDRWRHLTPSASDIINLEVGTTY